MLISYLLTPINLITLFLLALETNCQTFLSIILNNTAMKRVSNVEFLGVIIDEHLTWNSHINLVKNKAAKMICIIKRLKFTLPLSALRTLYNAFVLPCHNNYYGIILWGGYKTPLQPIYLLQKKAVSLIAGFRYLAN